MKHNAEVRRGIKFMKRRLELKQEYRRSIKLSDFNKLCIVNTDVHDRAMLGLSVANPIPHDNDIYRVDLETPTRIEVMCFGMDKLDDGVEGVYDNINDLPIWMQERISVLSMLAPNTSGGNNVEGIGRRITESIYWVYA